MTSAVRTSITNGRAAKRLRIEWRTWFATALAASSLLGCGSETGGVTADENSPSFSAEAASDPMAFVNTPDDGLGHPISDELRAQLEVELSAHPVEELDQKTLKAGVAFNVGFANNADVTGQVIASANTHICYLVAQGARIRSPELSLFLLDVDSNANIIARKSPGTLAQVRCVPRDFFTASFGAKPHQNYFDSSAAVQCGSFQSNSALRGNVVQMLAGIGLDYAGLSDNFWILQADTSSTLSRLRIEQGAGDCIGVGYTAPVAFNTPTVTFEGPNGVGTASAAGEWSYSAAPSASVDRPLTHGGATVSALDSECYFTYLGGSFSGAADLAFLRIQNNNWYLSLLGTSSGVRAKVRCVRHVQ